jgi:hypothetical protein
MIRKAIVKLGMVLALVLLVGAAASSWAQSDAKTDSAMAAKKAGAMCGGIAGTQCPAGQACKYPSKMCNVADLAGTCVKVAATCPKGGAKVCGCDGKTYTNQCELLKAGVHQASSGACPAPKPAA